MPDEIRYVTYSNNSQIGEHKRLKHAVKEAQALGNNSKVLMLTQIGTRHEYICVWFRGWFVPTREEFRAATCQS